MTMPTTSPSSSGWSWFPWAIGGALGVTIAANICLIWFAGHTFPGEAASRPYEVGIAYNQVLANAARQTALGWQVEDRTEHGVLTLSFTNQQGAPLGDLAVTASIERPVGATEKVALSFEPIAPGVYRATRPLPAAGQWEIKLTARSKGEIAYIATRRLVSQ